MNFEDAIRHDPTVNRMVRQGLRVGVNNSEEIIAALATQKEMMMKRIEELEAIAPKKMVWPDGRVMIWRCPEDMIPITESNIEL